MIYQNSKKQKIVSTLIIKAKYIAFEYKAKKTVWIKKFINKIKLKAIKNLMLYQNNKMGIV